MVAWVVESMARWVHILRAGALCAWAVSVFCQSSLLIGQFFSYKKIYKAQSVGEKKGKVQWQ